jgi:glycosyltransferase Alg8
MSITPNLFIRPRRAAPSGWSGAWRGVSLTLKVTALFLLVGIVLRYVYRYHLEVFEHVTNRGLIITVGILGCIRMLWRIFNCYRAFIFQFLKMPRLRRQVAALPLARQYPAHVYFIIPTLREELMITRRQVKSILREALKIPCQVTAIYATGDEAEQERIRDILRHDPRSSAIDVQFTLQDSKRDGMARALKLARSLQDSRRNGSLVVLMDGDTVMGLDLLPKTLPLFAVRPKMGGLTTVNYAMTRGGGPWFRDFYNFRFAARSHYMNALSFANCVFTLTGRFSVVRGEIGLTAGFIEAVENDWTEDFIHGKIRLITGDDKSTWFYLKKMGWDMICLPDAYAYAMENAGETPFATTARKLHRWMGNMLRFNWRALALGPGRIGGWWVWITLLDQRICMWTSLIGIITALVLSIAYSPFFLLAYLSMVIIRRLVYLWMLRIEGNRLTVRYLPILILSQWFGTFIKLWILSDMSKQQWTRDRVGHTASPDHSSEPLLPVWTGRLYVATMVIVFLYAVVQLTPTR